MTFQDLLNFEAASKTIAVKTIYIDMAGDLNAGIMLGQIVYWHKPTYNGGTKLRIRRNGSLWLAKADADWWEEIRLSEKQSRRAREILCKKGLVVCETFRFAGTPKTHFRINELQFIAAFEAALPQSTTRPTGQVNNKEYMSNKEDLPPRGASLLQSNYSIRDLPPQGASLPIPSVEVSLDPRVRQILKGYFDFRGRPFSRAEFEKIKASTESLLADGNLSDNEVRDVLLIDAFEDQWIMHEEAIANPACD